MDEKTEQLRDIFMDVADGETVTETQQDAHGSLATDEGSVDAQLQSVLERLHGKFDLQSSLEDDQLCQLVRAFYAGEDDDAIAGSIGCTSEAVFRTRMDLHLVRDDEVPNEELETAIRAEDPEFDGDVPVDRLAAEFDADRNRIERAAAAVAAVDRSRRVSQRFRTAFEEVLTDADLSVQFTAEAHEDGLEDATEGAEVGVEL
ncbi:MAG: hypothetical protein J07HX64_00778 [halophilic archaeon J07HX64]|jgi:hypothetical protein|nr:MAG: hypothetical protein J07HX64_00778 [halophilic archaeon J07HX64]